MNYSLKKLLLLLIVVIFSYNCYAETSLNTALLPEQKIKVPQPTDLQSTSDKSSIQKRADAESDLNHNRFIISFYKPTYILPYYYTASPDNQVYLGSTPGEQSIKSSEAKFQFSLKVPIFVNLVNNSNNLYVAYTQLSYWQVYSKSAFFRETDFEPEIFLSHKLKYFLGKGWYFDFINLGLVHQSNGFGGSMERTWNRAYVEGVFASEHWMVRLKPWYIIHDSSYNTYNPDLAHYLGYGQIIVAYQKNRHVLAVTGHTLFQNHSKRATAELSYSFPLTLHFNGYVQVFSGYGQSLIEYNHRTNSVGVGISLSNWI